MLLTIDCLKPSNFIYSSLAIQYPYYKQSINAVNGAIDVYNIISFALGLSNIGTQNVSVASFNEYMKAKCADYNFNSHFNINQNKIATIQQSKAETECFTLLILANYLRATISIGDSECNFTYYSPTYELQAFPYVLTVIKLNDKYICLLPANIALKYEVMNNLKYKSTNYFTHGRIFNNAKLKQRAKYLLYESKKNEIKKYIASLPYAEMILKSIRSKQLVLINSFNCYHYAGNIFQLKSIINETHSYHNRSLLAAAFQRANTQLTKEVCPLCSSTNYIIRLGKSFNPCCIQCLKIISNNAKFKKSLSLMKLSLVILLT